MTGPNPTGCDLKEVQHACCGDRRQVVQVEPPVSAVWLGTPGRAVVVAEPGEACPVTQPMGSSQGMGQVPISPHQGMEVWTPPGYPEQPPALC